MSRVKVRGQNPPFQDDGLNQPPGNRASLANRVWRWMRIYFLLYIKNNISVFSLCVKEKYHAVPIRVFSLSLRLDISIPGVFGDSCLRYPGKDRPFPVRPSSYSSSSGWVIINIRRSCCRPVTSPHHHGPIGRRPSGNPLNGMPACWKTWSAGTPANGTISNPF